jgi:hypothetical protein
MSVRSVADYGGGRCYSVLCACKEQYVRGASAIELSLHRSIRRPRGDFKGNGFVNILILIGIFEVYIWVFDDLRRNRFGSGIIELL